MPGIITSRQEKKQTENNALEATLSFLREAGEVQASLRSTGAFPVDEPRELRDESGSVRRLRRFGEPFNAANTA